MLPQARVDLTPISKLNSLWEKSVFYEVSEKGINGGKGGFVSCECICCGYHSCGHGMCMASCLRMRSA